MCIEKQDASLKAHKRGSLIEASSEQPLSSTETSPLIATCLNVFYYLFYIPFLTQFDGKTQTYTLKTSKFQQVVCAGIHCTGLGYMIYAIFSMIKQIESYDTACIMSIFDIVCCCGWLCSGASMIYVLWWDRPGYLQVLKSTRFHRAQRGKHNRLFILLAALLPVAYVFTGILSFSIIEDEVMDKHHMTKHKLEGFHGHNHNMSSHDSCTFCLSQFTYKHLITLALTYFNQFYSSCHVILFSLALTLNQTAGKIEADLNQQKGLDHGILLYRNLKKCMATIRSVFGGTLLGFFLASVSYLAQAPHILFGKRAESERGLMIYFVLSGIVWILAAEYHSKVRNIFTLWTDAIAYDGDPTDNLADKLKILKMSTELVSDNCNSVALGSRYFLVTYKHLTSMLGLILTYGIVVFQLHRTSSEET